MYNFLVGLIRFDGLVVIWIGWRLAQVASHPVEWLFVCFFILAGIWFLGK